jgi:hypothetical protein
MEDRWRQIDSLFAQGPSWVRAALGLVRLWIWECQIPDSVEDIKRWLGQSADADLPAADHRLPVEETDPT